MRTAALFLETSSNTANFNLLLDDSGHQTWKKTDGFLNIGGNSGVWRLGAWQDSSTRILSMFVGPDYLSARLAVMLNHVPAQFIDSFCQRYTGDGYLVAGGQIIDDVSYTIDVNPCS